MNDYVIGSGAVLTAGPNSCATRATLHAQTEPIIAASVRAALIDFEATASAELSKIVIIAAGWNARRFEAEVMHPLLARGACTLAEILAELAAATGSLEVDLFARWLPDDLLVSALRRSNVAIVTHPLESIAQAALICGQSYSRWVSPLQAA